MKSVEVGNTDLNQFQILAQKALSLAKRIDQLFQATKVSQKTDIFHTKRAKKLKIDPEKSRPPQKQRHFNPLARKGTKLNFKVTF